MKFFTGYDVYQLTIEFLHHLGHTITRAKDVGLAKAADENLLEFAKTNKLTLITRDKDFGALVFLKKKPHYGVIFLRLAPWSIDLVHDELKKVIQEYEEETFINSFIVVEPGRHRVRLTS